MSLATLSRPRTHQIDIGVDRGVSTTFVGVVERVDGPLLDVLYGLALNEGTGDYTLALGTGKASTGTVTLSGQPTDGNTVVIDDGPNAAVTFEFDNNGSVTPTNTLRQVVIGATLAETMANLVAAINAAPVLNVIADPTFKQGPGGGANSTVYLHNDNAGTAGNVTITSVGAVITSTGMSGGMGAAKNIRVGAASVASVVVKPRARVIFLIEIAAADVQDFYNFTVTPATGSTPSGRITLAHYFGELYGRERIAY